jgi:hypothetical protein
MNTHHGDAMDRTDWGGAVVLARRSWKHDRVGPFVFGLFLMWMAGSSIAQQPSTPMLSYDDISYPKYRYAASVSSLHKVDFKNLKVFWFAGEEPDSSAKLRNGAYQRKSKDNGYEKVNLDLIEFLDPPDGGEQHAVIDLEWWDCGGSCTVVGRVQVFEVQAGHPTVVQEIEYDRHAPGTGVQFDPRTQVLTIVGRSTDHTPNCCPKNLDVMRFDWDGKKFAFRGAETKPVTDTRTGLPVGRH